MSCLVHSIADTLLLQEDGDDEAKAEAGTPDDVVPRSAAAGEDRPLDGTLLDLRLSESESGASEDEDPGRDYIRGRGVKEDLSEFTDSFARQLWGVASFLAPPPPPPQRSDLLPLKSESGSDRSVSDADEEEYEELVESGARLPGQLAEQEDLSPSDVYCSSIVEEAVGITDEVLAFARNIAHHPETWLDFPLSEDEDFDDFDISDDQYKHALAVEHLAPRLSALRIELCPAHMTVGYFWMVYFVLLHSRLNKNDANALSSTQLVMARAMWMQALQKQTKEASSYGFGTSSFHFKEQSSSQLDDFSPHSFDEAHFEYRSNQLPPFERSSFIQEPSFEHEIEKHPVDEIEFVDKSVIREDPAPKLQDKEMIAGSSSEPPVAEDIDDDDWLKEDSDLIGFSCHSIMVNEEDISFSDLEDDCATLVKYKTEYSQSNKEDVIARS